MREQSLTDSAFDRMTAIFSSHDHRPSQDQLVALRAIQECMTAMLMEKAGRVYYLSSLDPGVGKTSSIVSWIKAYRDSFSGSYPQGILICVDRLDEVRRYVEDCSLPQDSFAVLAGKSEIHLNSLGLGHANIDKALVLFTTKEQIRRRSKGISLDDQCVFLFNGKPRAIKVWDESLSVGKDIVINPYDFGKLYTPLAVVSEELVGIIQNTMQEILSCQSGAFYTIPELPELPRNFFESVRFRRSEDRELLELLWKISGQIVTIRKDRGTQLIIDCVQSIPNDFPPCLILDASGRIKGTYKVQQRQLENLVTLPYSNKSYRNLEIHVWDRAGGRGITKDLKTITPELVKIIKTYSDEEFMFLLYRDQLEDVRQSLSKHLSASDMERVKYCTHGQHTATNEFCKIPNIIALSAYQYPDPTYDAITRAAGLMTTEGGVFPTQSEINMVKKGEISSNFLQGVTRGKPRKSEGDTCPPSRLWLIAHPKTGLRKELPVIFPDSVINDWKTQDFTLTKKQQQVFDLIKGKLKDGLKLFPCAPIRNQLGMQTTPFKKMLVREDFQTALASIDTMIVSLPKGLHIQSVT